MDTSTGKIRDIVDGEKLKELEIEITEVEKKEMLRHNEKDRFKELEKMRKKQLQAVNRMKVKQFVRKVFR